MSEGSCNDVPCVVLPPEIVRRARLTTLAGMYDNIITAIRGVSTQARNLNGSGGHITALNVLPMVNALREMFTLCGISRDEVDRQILAAVESGARPKGEK